VMSIARMILSGKEVIVVSFFVSILPGEKISLWKRFWPGGDGESECGGCGCESPAVGARKGQMMEEVMEFWILESES
jgi:hypothetical protein